MLSLLFSCHGTRQHDRPSAERALKALDSDLTALMDGIGNDQGFSCIQFLFGERSAPVPFKKTEKKRFPEDTVFSLETHKGVYLWSEEDQGFAMTRKSDSVIILFDVIGEPGVPARFVISEYKATEHPSRPAFPTIMEATLFIDDEERIRISHRGEIDQLLPLLSDTRIDAGELKAHFYLHREPEGERSHLKTTCEVAYKGRALIEGGINAELGHSYDQYHFITIQPDLRVFDVTFRGTLDYGDVDPTAADYVADFNRHCHIDLIDDLENKRIGQVGMVSLDEGDVMDYAVWFADGTAGIMQDYLLLIRKLSEYKYQ